MRIVLDTNVILAAFGTRGLCEAVMAICLDRHEIFLSEPILTEVAEHFQDRFGLPVTQAREIVAFLRDHSTIVAPVGVPARACRDADDLAVLGTIVAAEADCLITGDRDLLSLGTFKGVAILSPRSFHDLNC